MKKISISILSLAIFMMTACDNSSNTGREGADREMAGTTANSNSSQSEDPVERAKDMNEQQMEQSNAGGAMGSSSMEDKSDFVVEVANSSMLELELSKIAEQRASDPQVKQLAQKIVNDHKKMNQDLKSIAQSNNITIPQGLGQDMQQTYERISQLQGKEFDKEYLKEMESQHEESIKKFEEMANNEQASELSSFASNHLSALRNHQQNAEQLAERVDEGNNSGTGMGAGRDSDVESGSNSNAEGDTAVLKKDNSDKIIEKTDSMK
jgi:putative membrane protein